MAKRNKRLPLEGCVLAAFHQAYAEQAFEVADRLLSILEFMARQDCPGSDRAQSAVNEAYLEVAASAEVAPPTRRPKRTH